MKTERDKAFEKYVMSLDKFKNRKTVFVFQLDENGDYDNRDVYDLHHAWQASAQHQGYKLVPVETLEESLGWACIAEWDSPNKETDEEIRKHKSIIEKAMIGFTSV